MKQFTLTSAFRSDERVRKLVAAIAAVTTREWRLMEVCGGQTHAIVRYGLDQLLPEQITLLHGPGCPVCVTPLDRIDLAVELAQRPDVILCSFGDMMRVPGSETDLLGARARGTGQLKLVYSPLDAVKVAMENPDKEVVFFAVGFETTAPANALAILQAHQLGLKNFSLLVSQVLVPPAITALMSSPQSAVDAFLAAGHVCTIAGIEEYAPLCSQFGVPIVITGFEPVDILRGVLACIEQLESGRHEVENCYERSVRSEGNEAARDAVRKVFTTVDRQWRGIGTIPQSGLGIREEFASYDAARKLKLEEKNCEDPQQCISGAILQGISKPTECPLFGTTCTPEAPVGATMVSNEGACSAYYKYRHQK